MVFWTDHLDFHLFLSLVLFFQEPIDSRLQSHRSYLHLLQISTLRNPSSSQCTWTVLFFFWLRKRYREALFLVLSTSLFLYQISFLNRSCPILPSMNGIHSPFFCESTHYIHVPRTCWIPLSPSGTEFHIPSAAPVIPSSFTFGYFFIFYINLYFQLGLLWFYDIGWTFPELLNFCLCLTSLRRTGTKHNFLFMPYTFCLCSLIFVDWSHRIFCCLSNGRRGVFLGFFFFYLMEKMELGHCEGAFKY